MYTGSIIRRVVSAERRTADAILLTSDVRASKIKHNVVASSPRQISASRPGALIIAAERRMSDPETHWSSPKKDGAMHCFEVGL